MREKDRFRGCLIGGAVGDALGFTVEFLNEEQIFSRFGDEGIKDYSLKEDTAQISDDTQLSLFTANGLLYGTTRGMISGKTDEYTESVRRMYKCWYKTQSEGYSVDSEKKYSWLLNVPELYSGRAPGNTCMEAISNGARGSIENPINRSKGCGGVMRVAPIGLYFCDRRISYDAVDMMGAQTSALTHGHEMGYIPSATLVHIIRRIVEDPSIELKDAINEAIDSTERLFEGAMYLSFYVNHMRKAVELAFSDTPDLEAIHEIGEGWVAEETLAIAVFCALRYEKDFDKAIRTAVNHNGDSDSTGAITGNILGARIGYEAIPEKFKRNLELRDIILEIADDLCDDCQIGQYYSDEDEVWVRKYVKGDYKPEYLAV
ncbi:MAG: ADP-ribosylglycohydrolase family protein [Clostridiales bacterium]|nr:ADP-ribosylglycohydrolase family protein [Clostridiales bacterium]